MRAPASSTIAVVAGTPHLHVSNVIDLLSRPDTIKVRSRSRVNDGVAPPFLQESLRRAVKRDVPIRITLNQQQVSEFCSANPYGVFQHGFEHRLQLASRAGDNLENFRGRRLLFQRFTQIVGALAQFIEQPRVLDCDDGLGGEVVY